MFILMPSASFDSVTIYLMLIFILIIILWVWDIRKLDQEYNKIKDSLEVFKRYMAMASTVEINQIDESEW